MTNWHDDIKRDLRPFADPGTVLSSSINDRWLVLQWTSRRISHTAAFSRDENENIDVEFEGVKLAYKAFWSHSTMSDMLGLASMIMQSAQSTLYVHTRAIRQSPEAQERDAFSLLNEVSLPGNEDATTVVFITGEAGAGKTEVLRNLVIEQAGKYLRGEVDFIYLYVNAQGRALARLEEALATEIQDLRVNNLTYHVIPTLTRNGIIVPLIDGFDELLGVLGYEDSFSSLRRFLDDLNGRGCLIASARSTYYQQEFLSRSAKFASPGQRIRIDPIEILPWGGSEFDSYVEKRYEDTVLPDLSLDQFKSKMSVVFEGSSNSELRTKPFFVAKTADLILKGVVFDGEDLVEQLIAGYIKREHDQKLLDRSNRPILTLAEIRAFVQSVAEEMWTSETRSLDPETLRTLADLVFPDKVSSSESGAVVRERVPTMAFFSPSSSRGRVEFEHEIFFSYFLGRTLADSCSGDSSDLFEVLVRSVLPEACADFAARRIIASGTKLNALLSACARQNRRGAHSVIQGRENAGSLVAAFLRQKYALGMMPSAEGANFSMLVFAGESFKDIWIADSAFSDVEFRRCDLSITKITNSTATAMSLQEITVSLDNTRLELQGLNIEEQVYGIRVHDDEKVRQVFRNDMIKDILHHCGVLADPADKPSRIDAEFLDLLERVLRKFEKSNLFWRDDVENRQIISDPKWGSLEKMLIDAHIVSREEALPHKGVPRVALRRNYLPELIMKGESNGGQVPESIVKFWGKVELQWPAAQDAAQAVGFLPL